MKNFLCWLGVHWRVTEGGGMGDALLCNNCKRDKYPEVFGFYVFKRLKK